MKITKYTETCEIEAPSYIVVKFISGDCYTIEFTESENKNIGRICDNIRDYIIKNQDYDCYLINNIEEILNEFDDELEFKNGEEFDIMVYDISFFNENRDVYHKNSDEYDWARNYREFMAVDVRFCETLHFDIEKGIIKYAPFVNTVFICPEFFVNSEGLINLDEETKEHYLSFYEFLKNSDKIKHYHIDSNYCDLHPEFIEFINTNPHIRDITIQNSFLEFPVQNNSITSIEIDNKNPQWCPYIRDYTTFNKIVSMTLEEAIEIEDKKTGDEFSDTKVDEIFNTCKQYPIISSIITNSSSSSSLERLSFLQIQIGPDSLEYFIKTQTIKEISVKYFYLTENRLLELVEEHLPSNKFIQYYISKNIVHYLTIGDISELNNQPQSPVLKTIIGKE